MKRLTTVLLIAAFAGLLVLPRPATAGVQLGIKLGANAANVTGDDLKDVFGTLKSKTGFTGGLFLAFNLSKVITIQTEVLYTMKGSEYTYVDLDETYSGKLYADYIEIPLLLKLKIPTGGIQPFLLLGPSVGFKLQEKITGDIPPTDLPDTLFKDSDYGAIFGAGLNLGHSLILDVRYSLGLQKVIDTIEGEAELDTKNGVWSVTLGIAF